MKLTKILIGLLVIGISHKVKAQGPPITGDKAIMLAPGNKLIKTLTEFRTMQSGTISSLPFMFHYLPSTNVLLGIHIPFINYDLNIEQNNLSGSGLGDIQILAKYQFYRKDQMGKTFRMAAKSLQTMPTGTELNVKDISTGKYQSYFAIIAGLETIKYGITGEVGYSLVSHAPLDELRLKLGFGLPLKKPVYPVDQINLYFEYQNSWFTQLDENLLMFSQGIQYAKNQLTFEVAYQFPIAQSISGPYRRVRSLFLGSRYVF